MKADWSSRAAACPSNPSGGEHLVPVVADPAAGPAVPAAAGQAHRVGVGRAEERLGRGRAPVDQQPAARAVGEAEPSDVHRLGVVRADDVPEAQVQPEAAQRAQPGGQPVDLQVPVQRLLARCRRAPCARRRGGRTGRRSTARGSPRWPRSAARRRRSAPGRPWRRGGREGRTRWWSAVHVISSDLRSRRIAWRHDHDSVRRFWPRPAILRHDPGLAASPPVRYTLRVEGTGPRDEKSCARSYAVCRRARSGEVGDLHVAQGGARVGCYAPPRAA